MAETITKTEPKSVDLSAYNPIKAEIEKMRKINSDLVFQYDTPEGNKNARSHVAKIRKIKGEIESARVTLKSQVLVVGRLIDSTAAELRQPCDEMIDLHWKPIKEIEEREELAAKAKAEKIEQERLAKEAEERAKLEAQLAAERAEAKRVADELAEFKREQQMEQMQREAADRARADAEARAKTEQEAAAARERAAVEAQARAEREKHEAIIAAERAKVEAERAAVEAEKRRIADAETAKVMAEQRAIEQAALAKREKEQAVQRAQEEAVRKQREKEEAAERAKIAAQKAEAKRMKDVAVREALVNEIGLSIYNQVPGIDETHTFAIAELILGGKIVRVSVRIC